MSEKKKASETAAKSAKKNGSKKNKKETNSADVRKEVSTMVKSKALAMAQAVIGETEAGEVPKDLLLATVKYLFEVASIYPPQGDQEAATDEEDSLAKTLLRRLNIPEEPVRRDEDEEAKADSAEKNVAKPAQDGSESKDTRAAENSEEGGKPASI